MIFGKKKIGLALGCGGARGFAHIGVLKILEKNKIPIDLIAGTSMGAVIGALYSAEPNSKKVEKDINDGALKKIFDYTIPRCGFIKGERVEKMLEEKLNNIDFKDLKIPLSVTAFDVENTREVVFTRGNVAKAVRASLSIPGIFVPVENKNRILVDGAVLDPIPVEVLRKMGADIIIAVNVNAMKIKNPREREKAVLRKGTKSIPNIIHNAMRSFQVSDSEMCEAYLRESKPDFVININLEDIGTLSFDKYKVAIRAGERETKKSMTEIKKILRPNPVKSIIKEINKNPVVKTIRKITNVRNSKTNKRPI